MPTPISINNKGLAFEFKAYALDNNYKSLLTSGRVGFLSTDGLQVVVRRNLAPGEDVTFDSVSTPSTLMIRVEGGPVIAQLQTHQGVTPYETGTPYLYTGSVGDPANYDVDTTITMNFEISKFFFWSGTFINATVRNPAMAASSIQLFIIQG